MANRIPPPDPETNRLSQAKKLEEAQKIAAIASVDPDAQAKKRRFQEMMTPQDEEKKLEDQPPSPSPFQPSFHQLNSSSDLDLESIPSPSNSPPPNLNSFSPQGEDLLSDEGLPRSPDYWNQVDLPDQPISNTPQFQQESPQSNSQPDIPSDRPLVKGTKSEAQPPARPQEKPVPKKIEPSLFGAPGKPTPKKEAHPPSVKKGEEKKSPHQREQAESAPLAKYWETEPEPIQTSIHSKSVSKEKGKTHPPDASLPHSKIPLEQNQPTQPREEFSPFLQKGGSEGKGDGKKQHQSQTTIEIVQPATPSFPSQIHSEAVAATTTAAPYLRPEAVPLFYQMVGTIFTMTTQGVSTTEILLNNPAFAGSKFFGASIEIIKYSSAPDSFNIRLSGSNEAVTAFNQNIPGLMASFQTGGFRFRIGRIEATYASEKPLFRRKEKTDNRPNDERSEEER